MEEEFMEVNDVPESTDDVVETNNDFSDEDEPLDLGESHEMSEEDFEKFKDSLNDNQEDNSDDVIETTNDFNAEEDEPLDLGEPNEPLDDGDEPLDLGEPNEPLDDGDEPLDLGEPNEPLKSEDVEEVEEQEDNKNSEQYIPYEYTKESEEKALDPNADEHKGFTDYLQNWVNDDVKK